MLSLNFKREQSRKDQYKDVLNYVLIEQVVKRAIEAYDLNKIESFIQQSVKKAVTEALGDIVSFRLYSAPEETNTSDSRPIAKSSFKKKVDKKPEQIQLGNSFTLPEAARYLKIGESTFRKYLAEHKINGTKTDNKWSFTKAQLDQYSRTSKDTKEVNHSGEPKNIDEKTSK